MLRELKGAPAQLAAGAALLGLLAMPAAGRAQAPELHSDSAAPVEAVSRLRRGRLVPVRDRADGRSVPSRIACVPTAWTPRAARASCGAPT
jgi:hypothetical protein